MNELATKHGSIWVRTYGEPPAAVVALHGFTLHGGMYRDLAERLGVTVAAPDLPGHGRTAISPVTIASAVDVVAAVLALTPHPPLLLGYSQGGRIALQTALTHPHLIGSMLLVSTAPGLAPRDRRLRREADAGLADRIESIGIERFIDEWLANPMTSTTSAAAARRNADKDLRLENTTQGLAAALRGMGQSAVADCSRQIPTLPMPIAFMAGSRDEKYAALATAMARSRDERPVLVEGAGHNVVLEASGAVAEAATDLLNRQNG